MYTISTTEFAIKIFAIKLSRNAKAESGEFFTKTEAEFFVKTEAESNCQKQDVMEFHALLSKIESRELMLRKADKMK